VPVLTPTEPVQRLQRISLFVIALTGLIAMLYYGRAFCITLVISIILAFILEPFVTFLMRFKLPRTAASFLVCSLALLLVYFAGLGVYAEVTELADDLPVFSERANTLFDSVAVKIDRMEQNLYKLVVPKRLQETAPPIPAPPVKRSRRTVAPPPEPDTQPAILEVKIRQERTPLVQYVYSYVSDYYNVLLMISFIPFLVYFMLSWRDHLRKAALSLFHGPERQIAGRSWTSIAEVARAYVFGNFLLGILLAIASSILFWSWNLPYFVMVGVVSGFLSLVPYVGLPLAILPPLIAALPVYESITPYIIIAAIVAFFHLLALNLLYPAIVGARVHLNPLVVTVALMFWGTLWGGIGLVLAIPITAGLKAVFDNVERLQPYGKLLGD
jgi:predicted PurR-regulated permease PerM